MCLSGRMYKDINQKHQHHGHKRHTMLPQLLSLVYVNQLILNLQVDTNTQAQNTIITIT